MIRFRPFSVEHDYHGMVAVHQARSAIDGVDALSTRESIPDLVDARREVARLRDPARDLVIAEDAREIVGYARVTRWHEARNGDATVYLVLAYVVPDARASGTGVDLLAWGERRCREIADETGAPPPMWLASNASETELYWAGVLEDSGYRVVRVMVEMILRLSPSDRRPARPSTIAVRRVTRQDLAAVTRGYNEAYAQDPLAVVLSEDSFERWWTTADQSLWHAAWDGPEFVGFVNASQSKGRCVLDELFVRPGWRREGVASTLCLQVFGGALELGLTEVRLDTNDGNSFGARSLYEKLGFGAGKRFRLYRREMTVAETV